MAKVTAYGAEDPEQREFAAMVIDLRLDEIAEEEARVSSIQEAGFFMERHFIGQTLLDKFEADHGSLLTFHRPIGSVALGSQDIISRQRN